MNPFLLSLFCNPGWNFALHFCSNTLLIHLFLVYPSGFNFFLLPSQPLISYKFYHLLLWSYFVNYSYSWHSMRFLNWSKDLSKMFLLKIFPPVYIITIVSLQVWHPCDTTALINILSLKFQFSILFLRRFKYARKKNDQKTSKNVKLRQS